MTRSARKILLNILYAAASIGLVLAVWAIAAAVVDTELILPSIGETFEAFGTIFGDPTMRARLGAGLGGTLARSVLSFAVSFACFFLLFFLCTVFDVCARIVEPIISALRTLPTMALSLLLAIWAGGYYAPVIVGALVTMPYMYAAAKARNATVQKELEEICTLLGAGRVRTFCALWLPHVAAGLPEITSSAFSFGMKAVISAEILMQTADSLGHLMNLSKVYFETAMLIAFVFVAVVVAVASEYIIKLALRAALRKYEE